MAYDIWGRRKGRETRVFSEKAFRRGTLAAWDARWHDLSVQARFLFLHDVKGPVKKAYPGASQPSVAADRFPMHALKELTAAGFVEVRPGKFPGSPDRVFAVEDSYDFATRLRKARQFHLLAADQPSLFVKYVDQCFFNGELPPVLSAVLRKSGIVEFLSVETALDRYVIHQRWPGWVVKALDDPLAEKIVCLVEESDQPIALAELPGRIKGSDPAAVRSSVETLVTHLALVEDVHPQTWELVVGLLPSVREERLLAHQPRQRPPLLVCETPREIGPEGSAVVNDLRAFLLEVASEPPKLRQNHALFSKEVERFAGSLEPLPAWLAETLEWTTEGRISQAHGWAHALKLVKEVSEGKQLRLQLATKGHQWMSKGVEDQYREIYEVVRAPVRNDLSAPLTELYFPNIDFFGTQWGSGDLRFLGANMTVFKTAKGRPTPSYWNAKTEDHQALRQSLDRALSALSPGVFYRLHSVIEHLVFRDENPVLLGLKQDQVAVFWYSRTVPPLEEEREEAGRLLLRAFVRRRLIPLGCVRTAIDEERKLCIARHLCLDAYFGREVPRTELAPDLATESRVVVQPDFSVIVIGLNPAPAAELAPFCERVTRGGGQGALVLKLTRESVIKAVAHGLKPSEIVARLRRHAGNEPPANVLREVQGWCDWVRRVTPGTLTVLRCPDRETADRVMSALKRQGERVNETMVAVDRKKLTTVERNKLRDQGIIVQSGTDDDEERTKVRKKRRRY